MVDKLYLQEDNIALHSSDRSWVSVGRIIQKTNNATTSPNAERVAAKLCADRNELYHEFCILKSMAESITKDFVVGGTMFLEPASICGLESCGYCGNYYALVMERGCYDLSAFLRNERYLSLDAKMALAQQLISIVAAINNAGLVWNDVKPSNFVFIRRQDKWKGIDMESVQPIGTQLDRASYVTVQYACPEIAAAIKHKNLGGVAASAKMDAWSLGMTLLCVFAENGLNYFDFNNLVQNVDVLDHLCSAKCQRFIDRYVDRLLDDHICETDRRVLHELLQVDQQARMSAAEAALNWR